MHEKTINILTDHSKFRANKIVHTVFCIMGKLLEVLNVRVVVEFFKYNLFRFENGTNVFLKSNKRLKTIP